MADTSEWGLRSTLTGYVAPGRNETDCREMAARFVDPNAVEVVCRSSADEPWALAPVPASHWLTTYDPDDGEPYGTSCDCPIGEDHNGKGEPVP